MQIQGMEEVAPPGVARGLPCSLLWVPPFPEEFGIQRRSGSHWGSQFRRTTRIGARGPPASSRSQLEFRRGECEGALPRTPNRRVAEVGDLEGLNVQNTQLVAEANHGTLGGPLQKSWHIRYGPLLDSWRGRVNNVGWRMTIRPHLHCHVFARWISCHCQILSLPAWISGKSSMRRWWHMPRLISPGGERLICLLEVNHAFWWGAL